MNNQLDVIVKPVNLRFSFYNGEIYYLFGGSPEACLDQAELFMGVGPENRSGLLESNLGFLPVCSTVLIRGEKNVLVDPNNHHVGFYGMLGKALESYELSFEDIDFVVATHWHHDHSANLGLFSGELVIGKGELSFGREVYGNEDINAKTKNYNKVTEIDNLYELIEGVKVVYTPGHSPGSVSVLVDSADITTAIMGDSIMTKSEWYDDAAFSHWYTNEQIEGLKSAREKVKSFQPNVVIPGHDREFKV